METAVHDLTAGYALDALAPDERHAYEAHLESCERCREELSGFLQTTEALALAATGPVPSPDLRGRILAAAHAEPQNVVAVDFTRRRRTEPVLAAVAALAAVVAVGIGVWASQVSGDLDDARIALERERAAAAILADSSSRTIALEAGQGRLVVGDDGRAVLVLDDLEPAPSGKTYETWIVHGGRATPAGLFPGRDGVDVVSIRGTLEPGSVVAVTLEDAGGVEVSENDPIVASRRV